jgi:virginiamycin A acetyltransferase
MIVIHSTAKISKFADIEDSIKGSRIEIGEQSVVDSFVKIKPAGGLGDMLVGARCNINSGCVFYLGNGIRIGNDVAIAANCTFAPVNHRFDRLDISIRSQGFMPSRGGIVIEDNVWIGANCVILDGAKVCSGAIIGAGTIVRGIIPSNEIHGGNPIRYLRARG